MSTVIQLQLLGQSIWYDNLKRSLILDGTIKGMIERREIYGITSNPSIFEKAIRSDADYAADLQKLSWAGLSSEEIFYRLAIKDIQDTADLFWPYYEASNGADGFVSLEVNPNLANDTQATIDEAKWLWTEVNRPNLMVKIPATKAGLPAITEVIASGVNVNVTLIFSRERYIEVMDAYLMGLEKRLANGMEISQIASVASFFVSRLESNADKRLQVLIDQGGVKGEEAKKLIGKLAVDNTRLAYQAYLSFFKSSRFKTLAAAGAREQRPLWASTSTKDPTYKDTKYVDELVAENSVNTVPPETLIAYLDHGDPAIRIDQDLDKAEANFETLAKLGISIEEITQELEEEGVRKFAESFEGLIEAIEFQRSGIVQALGSLADAVQKKIQEVQQNGMVARVYRNDPTLWTATKEGKQIVQTRLGWLALPKNSEALIPEIIQFAEDCRADGFKKVLILGMGGSSLAPETMSLILGEESKGLSLRILDSTLPAQVSEAEAWVDFGQTLFIIASKSGTTSEPLAMYKYFKNATEAVLGDDWASHFVAITDPGSELAKLGETLGFRAVFTADPNVGGRYSALSHFGLVPAALMGIDLTKFLDRAQMMAEGCSPLQPVTLNLGALLGIILGVSFAQQLDKLTLLADQEIAPIGAWMEQLIAESSGKNGYGIVPIADEPLMDSANYRRDRLFIYLRLTGELDSFADTLKEKGHPVIVLHMKDIYDLAGQFFCWEFAVAIACSLMGVNAFDQPDVQDSKDRTKEKLAQQQETGHLVEPKPVWTQDDVIVNGQEFNGLSECRSVSEVIEAFVARAEPTDYIAINAYLPRTKDMYARLDALRKRIQDQTGCATTLGFGPRFLHSTGQLHKGGANNGLFIQITQDNVNDLAIPGDNFSFGVLARAQALGDLEALLSRGRRAIRLHLSAHDPLAF